MAVNPSFLVNFRSFEMHNWFSTSLLKWYNQNKRDLPWRHEKDPYKIWLSEVILQQTQVAQGLSYYLRFIKSFPTVKSLAAASEDKVLKLWQGLGYYSRARNLHEASKQIVSKYNGKFPKKYEDIRMLKGVGDYTASAISSFAFDQKYAVVDGNVYRLLSRLFGILLPIDSSLGKKEFQILANTLLNEKQPGLHNQAIMEFGSQHCKASKPDCERCIFQAKCFAYQNNQVDSLPVKSKKTKVKIRHFNYFVAFDPKKNLLTNKRTGNDIWKGLYEFPLLETSVESAFEELIKLPTFPIKNKGKTRLLHQSRLYTHLLSHQKLQTTFYVLVVGTVWSKNLSQTSLTNLKKLAFPRLIEKFLDDCDLKELF